MIRIRPMKAKAIIRAPSTSGRNKSGACEFIFQARRVMRVYSGHWLDYDPVALVILVVGIGAVVLLALSI